MEAGLITVDIELDEDYLCQVKVVLQPYSITLEQAAVLFFGWCVENRELAGRELVRWQRSQEEVLQDVH